jgi:hypothetical protein
MAWKNLAHEKPADGVYLVARFHTLELRINLCIGSAIDGRFRSELFSKAVAWMPLPEPPTMSELGLDDLKREAAEALADGGWLD